jgi:hypothetical protein
MKRFALLLFLSACSNGPITNSDTRTPPSPSQYDPARYGTHYYRITPIAELTARQIQVIDDAMYNAQSIGPGLVRDINRIAYDIAIDWIFRTDTGCDIRWSADGFQLWGCNSDTKLANAVSHGVVRWLGNQLVCASASQTFRMGCDQTCSPVGVGSAVSNSNCLNVFTRSESILGFPTDYIGPLTQLDLDEFRRNHP